MPKTLHLHNLVDRRVEKIIRGIQVTTTALMIERKRTAAEAEKEAEAEAEILKVKTAGIRKEGASRGMQEMTMIMRMTREGHIEAIGIGEEHPARAHTHVRVHGPPTSHVQVEGALEIEEIEVEIEELKEVVRGLIVIGIGIGMVEVTGTDTLGTIKINLRVRQKVAE